MQALPTTSGQTVTRASLMDEAIEKRSRLADLIRRGSLAFGAEEIPACDRPHVPLLGHQLGVWLDDRLRPGGTHNLYDLVHLKGAVDVDALTAAVQAVAQAYDAFRIRTTWAGGPVMERTQPGPLFDICEMIGASREEVQRAASQLAAEAFDLERAPLVRIRLIRTGPQSYYLAFVAHHLVADGWSLGLVLGRLSENYEVLRSSGALPAGGADLGFFDYVHARQATSSSEADGRLIAELAERIPEASAGPDQGGEGQGGSGQGGRVGRPIAAALYDRLGRRARQLGLSLFGVLLAGYALGVGRWTGLTRFTIAVPVEDRPTAKAQSIVGMLVCTTPVSFDLDATKSCRQVLDHIRSQMATSYAARHIGLYEVIRHAGKAGKRIASPAFEYSFNLHNWPLGQVFPSHDAERVEIHNGTSGFDMSMLAETHGDILKATLEFSTRRLTPEAAGRFLDLYEAALTALSDFDDLPIQDVFTG